MPLRISRRDSAAWAAKLGLNTGKTRKVRLCVECQRRPALKVPRDFPGCGACFKSWVLAELHPVWGRREKEVG